MKTDGAGFLRRWAERKQAARLAETQPAAPDVEDGRTDAEPFDPASLPPIDSLGADSDYTPFLQPGAPLELTKAALRQAWLSDPVISTFREMADYDWDFNAPGYGALLPTDDVQAMLSRIVNKPEPTQVASTATEETSVEKEPEEVEASKNFVAPPLAESPQGHALDTTIAASQQEPQATEAHTVEEKPLLRRPRHGGALPG